jgi:hypothetical protein
VRGADRKDYPDRLGWGEAWGGSSPAKSARLEAEFLRPLGAHLGRIPLGRKEYDGSVERRHRTDDEAFYLPCVLSLESVEAFLGAGLGWLYHYNYERVHFGYGMAVRTPYGCCVALGFSGSGYVGLMPVVLLDDIVLEWSCQGLPAVNDVLTQYIKKISLSAQGCRKYTLCDVATGTVAPPTREDHCKLCPCD